jgi:hypothetical protein
MIPKEKAQELYKKYAPYMLEWDGVDKWAVKECALIAVDEIIEALHEHHWQNRLIIDFWKEVKHEINNL